MKKVILCFATLLLIVAACKPNCNPKVPKGVQPIDWENYNDVYTVHWNYTMDCSNAPLGRTGQTIKMYGWIFHPQTVSFWDFSLLSDSLFVESNNPKCAMVRVQCFNREEFDSIQAKFNAADRTKKCYVTGELGVSALAGNDCCTTSPDIFIDKADDIYFE